MYIHIHNTHTYRNLVAYFGSCISDDYLAYLVYEHVDGVLLEDYYRERTTKKGSPYRAPIEIMLSWVQDCEYACMCM